MDRTSMSDDAMANIENYALDHNDSKLILEFPEGDSYKCVYCSGEYDDNDEEPSSPTYKEWYEIYFEVLETIAPGPNKDPEYDFISISEKHMPSKISCGDVVLYDVNAK